MIIRQLPKDELHRAVALSLEVFTLCGTEDYNATGLESFKSFIFDERLMSELTVYGAYDEDELIGIMATKNEGKHISLLLIRREYHRKGIGRRVFRYALSHQPVGEITVNSSSYAVRFYQSLGFSKLSEEKETNGLRYTPMKCLTGDEV